MVKHILLQVNSIYLEYSVPPITYCLRYDDLCSQGPRHQPVEAHAELVVSKMVFKTKKGYNAPETF